MSERIFEAKTRQKTDIQRGMMGLIDAIAVQDYT